MSDQTVLFLRGLPGSGKSTLATILEASALGARAVAADDWFDKYLDGRFEPAQLYTAHSWCQNEAREYLKSGGRLLIVHNTGTQCKEIEPYRAMAMEAGAQFHVAHVEGNFGSVHGVPEQTITAMRNRWQPWVAPVG